MRLGRLERLIEDLNARSAGAAIGLFSPSSQALRRELERRLCQPAGVRDALLGEPVFEAAFGWEVEGPELAELDSELIHGDLVAALGHPPRGSEEWAFPANRKPYRHQLEAWRALRRQPARSVVVSSGTGSGKTECFLVPILDDLVRERAAGGGRLVGVRALFLYPLNALINSQKERLKAWMAPFDGDLRFCLYNGETPEALRAADERESPEQVLCRKTLRAEPPPVLVTNATMLEYMLVREEDSNILARSQGRLRWVVLDEAHSYVGSQAAELALLLRRVVQAFGPEEGSVRFIATSATIGDDSGSAEDLRRFMADLAGISPDRVSLVSGRRAVPPLPDLPTDAVGGSWSPEQLMELPSRERFEALIRDPLARSLRSVLSQSPALTLREIGRELGARVGGADALNERGSALQALDLCASAAGGQGAFLPLRAHLFHRTMRGLWTCVDPSCEGKRGTELGGSDWRFGPLFLERRESCPVCGGLVLEVVQCVECGAEYLWAQEKQAEDGSRVLAEAPTEGDEEEGDDLESLIDDEESEDLEEIRETEGLPRMVVPAGLAAPATALLDPKSGKLDAETGGLPVGLLFPGQGGDDSRCPVCRSPLRAGYRAYRPFRAGADFFLGVAIPALLEELGARSDSPGGRRSARRLLTFSDSRQGTARFALKAQLDAERNAIRSAVYHQIAASRASVNLSELEEKRDEIRALEALEGPSPVLRRRLETLRGEVAALEAPARGRLPWVEMETRLRGMSDFARLAAYWHRESYEKLDEGDLPRFLLLREFFRRPKRRNSLETMGLVALEYPALERAARVRTPPVWLASGLSPQEWADFLTLSIDFFVRSISAVFTPLGHINWFGERAPSRFLVGPEATADSKRQARWPAPVRAGRVSRLARLAGAALSVSLDDPEGRALVREVMLEAWEAVRPTLVESPDGFQLRLHEAAELTEVRKAWVCPVTRRLLSRTIRGLTPYMPSSGAPDRTHCSEVELPKLLWPFWRRGSGEAISREEIEEFLAGDGSIRALRDRGVWPELSDRVVRFAEYFRVEEHSAQIRSSALRERERLFKDGSINVLSSSTTMELGIDIGGLSTVAMNNTPPSPARFLQRAGRAGRRGEALALTVTLCRSTPHGEAVFANPRWAFDTPTFVPRVTMSSDRIAQRHLNALVLSRFFSRRSRGPVRLTTGAFFLPPEGSSASVADSFTRWCERGFAADREHLERAAQFILRRTKLENVPVAYWAETVSQEMRAASKAWLLEHGALAEARDRAQGADVEGLGAPALRAVERQIERLEGEYLLSELAVRGFLPGYGFPTAVVPFVPDTAEEIEARRHRSERAEREDNLARFRSYPSRDLPLALRDYSPGSESVIDGRVYRSAGVTLNWHIPAGAADLREVQSIRVAWRCRRCGSSGTHSVRRTECPSCGAREELLGQYEFLRPAGFTVDIRAQARNRIDERVFVPVRQPWISAGRAEWTDWPGLRHVRWRYSDQGSVLHRSTGLLGHGYAVCLRCGRAASEVAAAGLAPLPGELKDHRRLRGGDDGLPGGQCLGSTDSWAIKRNLWLGAESETDVFQLQVDLAHFDEEATQRRAALSLAVALRRSLCEALGIEEAEVGCEAVPGRTATGGRTHFATIFDTAVGGAGFVSHCPTLLRRLIPSTQRVLSCPRGCDSACHGCLLTADTQHRLDLLDRRVALEVLAANFSGDQG